MLVNGGESDRGKIGNNTGLASTGAQKPAQAGTGGLAGEERGDDTVRNRGPSEGGGGGLGGQPGSNVEVYQRSSLRVITPVAEVFATVHENSLRENHY